MFGPRSTPEAVGDILNDSRRLESAASEIARLQRELDASNKDADGLREMNRVLSIAFRSSATHPARRTPRSSTSSRRWWTRANRWWPPMWAASALCFANFVDSIGGAIGFPGEVVHDLMPAEGLTVRYPLYVIQVDQPIAQFIQGINPLDRGQVLQFPQGFFKLKHLKNSAIQNFFYSWQWESLFYEYKD